VLVFVLLDGSLSPAGLAGWLVMRAWQGAVVVMRSRVADGGVGGLVRQMGSISFYEGFIGKNGLTPFSQV
jgi:hypothetical protein